MKRTIPLLVTGLFLIILGCTTKKTELVLLGTVHQPISNFNSDSLYNILVKINPDLILFEVDSSFFTPQFTFKKTWDSNENIATVRYMDEFDVDVRPYEFTGRNDHRKKIGSRPTDDLALNLLDSVYRNNGLDSVDEKTYETFLKVNDTLNSFAFLGARAFNNPRTDKVAQTRQRYQYQDLLQVMERYPIFSNTYFIKNKNDSISYLEGYKRASKFWDLRNTTMAKHILHFAKAYRGKRIVVLNGYFHRYYLTALLEPKQQENGFIIKNFEDY
ncbi:ChaN family lipoprotein [Pareuzebyella sediminis]|uniref:ChaN family lipoprotein n=1 Tax=Pareuzebyella sediminis TaxID=2607998 RepID=UPI0011EDC6B8|nr:ChaN family lipoprotein [Pareuzebyella sediminis]